MVAGALIGATVNYVSQVAGNMESGMELGAALTTNIDVGQIGVAAGIGAAGGLIGGVAIPLVAAGAGSAAAAAATSAGVSASGAAIIGGTANVATTAVLAGAANAGLGTTQRMVDRAGHGGTVTLQDVGADLAQYGPTEFGIGAASGFVGQVVGHLVDVNLPRAGAPYNVGAISNIRYPVNSPVTRLVPDSRIAYIRGGAQIAAQVFSDAGLWGFLYSQYERQTPSSLPIPIPN